MDEKLTLKISKNKECKSTNSGAYDVYLNDWKLGKGVVGINLDMQAPERPKLIIECHPDHINIDGVEVETVFKNAYEEEVEIRHYD